jgi:hypothetical protein
MSTELHGQARRDDLDFPPEHRFAVMKTGAMALPSISIRTRRWQTASDLIVQGTGFTPGGDVVLTIIGIPGHDSAPEVRTWQAGPNGTLHFEAEFGLVWGDTVDAAGAVFVVARDESAQKAAFARLPHGCAAWIVIAH